MKAFAGSLRLPGSPPQLPVRLSKYCLPLYQCDFISILLYLSYALSPISAAAPLPEGLAPPPPPAQPEPFSVLQQDILSGHNAPVIRVAFSPHVLPLSLSLSFMIYLCFSCSYAFPSLPMRHLPNRTQGSLFASASSDGMVRVWAADQVAPRSFSLQCPAEVLSLAWDLRDGRSVLLISLSLSLPLRYFYGEVMKSQILIGLANAKVRIWNLNMPSEKSTIDLSIPPEHAKFGEFNSALFFIFYFLFFLHVRVIISSLLSLPCDRVDDIACSPNGSTFVTACNTEKRSLLVLSFFVGLFVLFFCFRMTSG